MSGTRVQETSVELAQIMTPNEGNFLGKVFGGAVLAMIDLCASATAQKFSGRLCVTAAFDRVDFREPIEIGELLTIRGHISYTGRTSMDVTINVFATNLANGKRRHTNTARVTMVALGDDGRPTPVPALECEAREEKIGFLMGRLRRELRTSRLAELEKHELRFDSATDAELSAWMAGAPIS